MLAIRTPNLIYRLAAMRKRLPAKGGDTLRMPRYDRLPTNPVPLSADGAPIPATALTRVDIDATVSLYGQYVALNQRVVLQNQDLVLAETAELLGLAMRMTEDQLSRDVLVATASYYNCAGGNNGDSPTNINPADLQEVASILLTNDAMKILDKKEGEDRFGTGPIRDAFIMLGHTRASKDLNNLPGYIPKWNYANQQSTLGSEHGSFEDFRFFISSVASIDPNASALGNDIYNWSAIGYESYVCVEQDNFSARFLYRPPIYSDALFQNVTCGYVFGDVTRVVNDLWCLTVATTLA
jgi:N4-gp56 family major capsid protein